MHTAIDRVKVTQINDHIWLLNEADEATGYLVAGTEKALVIDTMMGYTDIKALVRQFTSLPLIVVNTHGHGDHIGGNIYFDEAYLNEKDWAVAERHMQMPELNAALSSTGHEMSRFIPIAEGDIISLGGLEIEVFELPGHTPGSICLLDRKDRILFSGDSIIEQTWMQLEESSPMEVFFEGLERLTIIRKEYDFILTGHSRRLEDASLYEAHKAAVKEVAEGKTLDDVSYEWFGGKDWAHPYGKEPRRIVYKKLN